MQIIPETPARELRNVGFIRALSANTWRQQVNSDSSVSLTPKAELAGDAGKAQFLKSEVERLGSLKPRP